MRERAEMGGWVRAARTWLPKSVRTGPYTAPGFSLNTMLSNLLTHAATRTQRERETRE